jgi:trans-2,3-dihydro-3-hydroxyanthranilate isomerase
MKLTYLLLDVFTTERFKGNQLALVPRADGLLDDQMQAIAREFNLSETVFLTRPRSERHMAALRIFTPSAELAFAGHPTVGAAVVLGLQNKVQAVRLEEQVGLITALIENANKVSAEARFGLPRLPEPVGRPGNLGDMALALGIDVEAIGCGPYKPAVYSAGTAFHLVPVRNAAVLRRVGVDAGPWERAFPHDRHSVYVFTETPEEPDNDFAARMFGAGLGIHEDPGTGSAAAALIGLIAEYAGFDDGQQEYRLRQGHEMGRPCLISLQMRKEAGKLCHGGIGGHAVIVGEGALELDD